MQKNTIDPDTSESISNPKLSFIMCSRSDQYQGNSCWRLQTALNYLGKSVHAMGRENDVEVIVADWGSEKPLGNVLKLTPEASRIVNFLLIPPEIARKEQKDSPFPEVLALNSAVRRARGEYIGRIDQDTLVGKYFINQFFWMYKKQRLLVPLDKAVMLSNRRRIPFRFATLCPSFRVVDRYISWFGKYLPQMMPPPPHLPWTSYIGILLFHRNLWDECGGYDERFIYMDFMEFDIILRLAKKFTFVDIGRIVNFSFFHLDHEHPLKPVRAGRNRKSNPIRTLNEQPEEFHPNREDWGLNKYQLEVLPYPGDPNASPEIYPRDTLLNIATSLVLPVISGIQILGDFFIISLRSIFSSVIQKPIHNILKNH